MKAQDSERDMLLSGIAKHVILNASFLDEFGAAKWKSGIRLILYWMKMYVLSISFQRIID